VRGGYIVTKSEKLESISKFESAYSVIEAQIVGLSKSDLQFIPPVQDAWSINDTLVHLLDADMALWFRIRVSVAQPGFAIPAWDQEAWQAKLHYGEEDGPAFLEEAKALRRRVAAFLRRIVDDDWAGYYVIHPERGRLDLAALITIYREHIAFHVPLIKRNIDALKATAGR
jgi:hypothetical protein